MISRRLILTWIAITVATALSCRTLNTPVAPSSTIPSATTAPIDTPTSLPPIPVQPGEANPDEPVFISGEIPYTSPFFINSIAEPFVLLEDEAGFVRRDREFRFSLPAQMIGPVELHEDDKLTYSLSLPSVPQGTYVDIDNNEQEDTGVQVFAIAYWSNTWGDPFLEERDGKGWSTAYASTIVDPENDDEIKGGILIVWAPDDQQGFPTSFGEDGLLFTADDPTAPIPAGYNLVDLNQEPFHVYKEARPQLTLHEGEVAVNDFSTLNYSEAFQSLFEKTSREYPFTNDKNIDWQALKDQFTPRIEQANSSTDFYLALRDFAESIPDGHINLSFNADVFYEEHGGGFGMVLTELGDGRIIVTQVLPDLPAAQAGIQTGAEIITWDGKPIVQAVDKTPPLFGPYSSQHTRRLAQVNGLTRVPASTTVKVEYKNPDQTQTQQISLQSTVEYDSLFLTIPGFNQDKLALPIEAYVLEDSGLGYIRINTFSDDYNLMARLWERYITNLIDEEIPGLIIDVRANSGGSMGLSLDFAGYFFDQSFDLYQSRYYNDQTGQFELSEHPARIEPAPLHYDAPIAVLVSPNCVSACEGFAYAMQQNNRAVIVGHYPTAGAFGEVGRGQYSLPDELTMQFPTGRPETLDGSLLIENVGVIPNITVPVTAESALGSIDTVLEAAVQALLERIQ